ncbi:MAG: hypothetical protein NTW59_02130 [Candidatus Diapherotrites archaeon]|nr:hypothetical protein [Candidatus Diapherotrites archaeon]
MIAVRFLSFRKIAFILLFTLLTLVASRINFSQLVGSTAQYFTFFQFFGPIAGAFLGPAGGVASVLFAQLIDFFATGKAIEPINILRLLPMLFAAVYFAVFLKKGSIAKASVAIPIVCIALFVLHPIGAQAWYYSLFWTIPIIAKVFSKRLFLRSLGATFTAHAVGSVIWAWSVPMTAEQWAMLVPVTATERVLFALGISVSFLVFNNVLAWVEAKAKTGVLLTEQDYLLQPAMQLQKK